MPSEVEPTTLPRIPTGIPGFDAISHGGLPARGATLVSGAAGAGKTVFGLNIVARALERGESCIYVTFEEGAEEILAHAGSFDWGLARHVDERLQLVDARPRGEVDVAGTFDIEGLIAVLGDLVDRARPLWVVLDGIDQLVSPAGHGDRDRAVGEIRRLHRWLGEQGLAGILTAKEGPAGSGRAACLDDLQFLFSTVIRIASEIVGRRLSRKLRIAKYRGSAHVTDEVPLAIDDDGIHIPYYGDTGQDRRALEERVSTGVERLDRLVGGGYFRGSGVLISGEPGTSKTSLACAFAAAAAARGEKALFVSFDEAAGQIVRNVRSIGMDLQAPIDSGHLTLETLRAGDDLVEIHYLSILHLLDAVRPDCLVIDPVSALLKAGGDAATYLSAERLLDTVKSRGITVLMTSLVDPNRGREDTTAAHVSTIADTWMVLQNQVLQGERNRSLSIVKSRGTRHSNQMRELILSERGIELADVFAWGSEVLLGTARVNKEHEEALARKRERIARERRRSETEKRLRQAEAGCEEAGREAEQLRQELALEDELWRAETIDREQWQDEVLKSRCDDRRGGGGEGGESRS